MNALGISNTELFRASQNSRNEGRIVVDGNRISWPDDGWYEVQSATSFNTMHEGGRFADMPLGTYNVINHTTGEVFYDIALPASTQAVANSIAADITSREKFRIALPASGWYEVQSADTYETIAEGEVDVTVPAGKYNIINHTTGERIRDVVVGSDRNYAESSDSVTGIPEVPQTINVGGYYISVTPEDSLGETIQGAGLWGGATIVGGLAMAAATTAVTPPVAAAITVAGASAGLASFLDSVDFETRPSNATVDNTVVHTNNHHDSDENITTNTTVYEDGTVTVSEVNHNTGEVDATYTDPGGSTWSLNTTNDTDGPSSPQTLTVTTPEGDTSTFGVSPTGGIFADSSNQPWNSPPEPRPQMPPSTSLSTGSQNSENDTDASSGGSGTMSNPQASKPTNNSDGTVTSPTGETYSASTANQNSENDTDASSGTGSNTDSDNVNDGWSE